MTTMKRREFLAATASTAGGALLTAAAPSPAEAGQVKTPAAPKHGFQARVAKVEMLFTAPGLSANGMQCTEAGIWTIDNAGSRSDTPGRCKVYLSSYDGKVLRELSPEGTGPSGIGVDEDGSGDLDRLDLQPRDHPRRRQDRRDHREALHARRRASSTG